MTDLETYTVLQNEIGDSREAYWMLPTLAGVQSAKSLFGGVVRLVESAKMAGRKRGRMVRAEWDSRVMPSGRVFILASESSKRQFFLQDNV